LRTLFFVAEVYRVVEAINLTNLTPIKRKFTNSIPRKKNLSKGSLSNKSIIKGFNELERLSWKDLLQIVQSSPIIPKE